MFKSTRTLIRVEKVIGDQLQIFIPSWDQRKTVLVTICLLPEGFAELIPTEDSPPTFYFFAYANLGATDLSELDLRDFEFSGVVLPDGSVLNAQGKPIVA
ncbi:MAG: hypothetical protein Q7S32_01120 [bacterium]|nr:hypothetical protein [bacterium]